MGEWFYKLLTSINHDEPLLTIIESSPLSGISGRGRVWKRDLPGYIMEKAIVGDFSIVKAWKARTWEAAIWLWINTYRYSLLGDEHPFASYFDVNYRATWFWPIPILRTSKSSKLLVINELGQMCDGTRPFFTRDLFEYHEAAMQLGGTNIHKSR